MIKRLRPSSLTSLPSLSARPANDTRRLDGFRSQTFNRQSSMRCRRVDQQLRFLQIRHRDKLPMRGVGVGGEFPPPPPHHSPPSRQTPLALSCGASCTFTSASKASTASSTSTKQSAVSASSPTNHAFDRKLKRLQRDNAARRWHKHHGSFDTCSSSSSGAVTAPYHYDYLRIEMARRLVDRLDDMAIRSDESHDDDEDQDDGCGEGRFPLALDLGSGPGYVYDALCDSAAFDDDQDEGSLPRGGIGGVRKLVQLDSSLLQLNRYAEGGPGLGGRHHRPLPPPCDTYRLEWDEESLPLPFPTGTFDLVISSGSLHWVNDLPGVFSEVHRVLKPDGCFLLAMAGGASLPELRACLVMAEMERDGGVSPRVGPFVQLSDVGALLQRAGFALPTLDVDTIQLSYPHAGVLMEHLQRMGESNACLSRRRDHTSLDVFLSAACLYAHLFPLRDDGYEMGTTMKGGVSQGGPILAPEIEASVQIIYAIGWTPHHSQQQPRERGSATQKLSDRVNVIKE